MEKELLFEGKENASTAAVKEFSPNGAVLEINLTGKISGKAAGFISILMRFPIEILALYF
jgi:hypothetical protein